MTDIVDQLRTLLQGATEHPVWPAVELVGVAPSADGAVRVDLRVGEVVESGVPMERAADLYEARERSIKLEVEDPYHYGYEPRFWAEVDWLIATMRAEFPGQVIELCLLGGNRAAKTEYAAKRMCECLDFNRHWLLWFMHTDQSSSRGVQQERVWKYLPPQFKPKETGKFRKGVQQRMNYNSSTGFTENCFGLPHGARAVFKFYSGDSDSLEGDQPHVVWSDERIPLNWIKALAVRLLTRAGQTEQVAKELKVLLQAREAGSVTEVPRELRARMWQGVHLVTFTPLDGLTPAVSRFVDGAQTVLGQEAKQLPIVGPGDSVTGYEMLPRIKRQPTAPVAAAWFWNEDNKHGGNHGGMVKLSRQERWSDAEKKIKFYGFTEKTRSALFARFDEDVHVVPEGGLPRSGTWFHVVDPCNGRNWFMCWALAAGDGKVFVAREWPPVREYVPGWGVPGEWVVDSSGKKFDGDAGPAQQPLGWGCSRYVEEIERVERELWKLQNPEQAREGAEGRVQPLLRIMDSRYGASPNASHSGTKTIMELMEELGMPFIPSGQTVAAEGEVKGKVNEGWQLINDWLDFDATLATRDERGRLVPDPAQAPRLYVCAGCENILWVLRNYTGRDGQHGAGKDPADVLRYLVMADPFDAEGVPMEGWGGGGY